jgi:t-SNARE complex subunit (syntaxin)
MATVTDLLNELKEQLNELESDAEKVDKGQKAAGTRVRNGLQGVKKSCDSLRKHILSLRA